MLRNASKDACRSRHDCQASHGRHPLQVKVPGTVTAALGAIALVFLLNAPAGPALGQHAGEPGTPVEIALLDTLDEERGYCLDITGNQARARPSVGFQAHTCHGYQGRIAVDQAFDAAQLRRGILFMPAFDVCLTARPRSLPVLALESCSGGVNQRFTLTERGNITPLAEPRLCITASTSMGRPSGGGRPLNMTRGVSLQPCSLALGPYQRWQARPAAEFIPKRR